MSPYLQAIRPKTLIASLSPILIGSCFAFPFSFRIFLLTLLTGLGLQISTNLANDLFDYLKGADTKARKGPPRVTASGLLTIARVRLSTVVALLFTASIGCFLVWQGGFIIFALLALGLFFAVGYTAGPFPLAYLGLAEVCLLFFFGPVATASTAYLQTLSFNLSAFIAGLSPALFSCALLAINNLRDVEEDRQISKKTLVVRFGTLFGKREYAFCVGFACLAPLLLINTHPFAACASLCLLPALSLIQATFTNQDPYFYNTLLVKTAKLFTAHTLLFCVGLCF